ncbi:hypothetical protein XELAEV_18025226mg [Xenopus laevis]|uniref:GIY-YIG domain-containing protein n=1 Tax=Xenopus laevis TaxID=8355 RepID=A0A974HM60_XENLA|nr:hypothetical protein XELAEV_18025226mg [Xenopus laevis]
MTLPNNQVPDINRPSRASQTQRKSSIIKGDSITHPLKGYKIPIKAYYTCNTDFVIYALKCPCGKMYIGQTSRQIKIRIREHKYSISNYDPENKKTHTPVGKHFYLHKHNSATLRWLVLEKVQLPQRGGDRKRLLLQTEARWIDRMNTVEPRGMNEAMSYKCFL